MSSVPTRRVALSLMAHPDDCEFVAAGTLALLAARGWECHIVTMTPGDGGSMEHAPEEIAAIRRAEGAAAAALIGAHYHCLESRDLYVVFDEPTLRRAISLVRSLAPTLVFTHPLQDYMLDHEETAKIARSATFGYGCPNVAAGPVLPGSQVPWLYYADPTEGLDYYGNPVPATTLVDISSVIETKTDMLKAHASQREWLLAHHHIDQYVNAMLDRGRARGAEVGVAYAEGFRQHKGHAYPRECMLAAELGELVAARSGS